MTDRTITEEAWQACVKSIGIAEGCMEEQRRTIATLERMLQAHIDKAAPDEQKGSLYLMFKDQLQVEKDEVERWEKRCRDLAKRHDRWRGLTMLLRRRTKQLVEAWADTGPSAKLTSTIMACDDAVDSVNDYCKEINDDPDGSTSRSTRKADQPRRLRSR